LRITYIKQTTEADTWPDGAREGNHAKFFIVDDKGYYLGSQNLYIANLAEWGVIVDSEERTQEMLETYWKPLWENSYRPDANEVDVDQVMDSLEIERDGGSLDEADLETKVELLKSLRKNYHHNNSTSENTDLAELARRCGLTEEEAASALADEGIEFKPTQYEWVKFEQGDPLPEGAVLAGTTDTDGDVYVARNTGGEAGKLNLEDGNCNEIWCNHAGNEQSGQVFRLKDPDAQMEWVAVQQGDRLPAGAVYAGHTSTDGRVYVGRVETGACGKVNTSGGNVNNFWVHEGGGMFGPKGCYSEGEILVIDPKQTPDGRNIGE